MTTWELTWILTSFVAAFIFGRSVIIWTTLTYLVGWPAFVLLLVFGAKPKTWENRGVRLQSFLDKIEEQSKPKEYKDFNNVDDLFKQLENHK